MSWANPDEPPVSVQAVVFLDVVDDGSGKLDVVVAGAVVARVVRDERLAGVAGLVAETGKLKEDCIIFGYFS